MPSTSINIFTESENQDGMHRWHFCYLHGKAEFEYDAETCSTPDCFVADAPIPTEGNHIVFINNEPAIAVIAMRHGHICGRVSLLSDSEALRTTLDVKSWR